MDEEDTHAFSKCLISTHLLSVRYCARYGGESSEQDRHGLCLLSSTIQCRIQTRKKITIQFNKYSKRGKHRALWGKNMIQNNFEGEHQRKPSGAGGM